MQAEAEGRIEHSCACTGHLKRYQHPRVMSESMTTSLLSDLSTRLRVEVVRARQREAGGCGGGLDRGLLRQPIEEREATQHRAWRRKPRSARLGESLRRLGGGLRRRFTSMGAAVHAALTARGARSAEVHRVMRLVVVVLRGHEHALTYWRVAQDDACLEKVELRRQVSLLAQLLLGEKRDAPHGVAQILHERVRRAEEQRHTPDGAHVDVVQHVAAERVRQLLEHEPVVLIAALQLVAEMALHRLAHVARDAVAREELVDALHNARAGAEPQNIQPQHGKGEAKSVQEDRVCIEK
eukprot:1917003-Pleurochrysis_carterae.AAC.1